MSRDDNTLRVGKFTISKNYSAPHLGEAIGYNREGDSIFGDSLDQVLEILLDRFPLRFAEYRGQKIQRNTESWNPKRWVWIDDHDRIAGYREDVQILMWDIDTYFTEQMKRHAE